MDYPTTTSWGPYSLFQFIAVGHDWETAGLMYFYWYAIRYHCSNQTTSPWFLISKMASPLITTFRTGPFRESRTGYFEFPLISRRSRLETGTRRSLYFQRFPGAADPEDAVYHVDLYIPLLCRWLQPWYRQDRIRSEQHQYHPRFGCCGNCPYDKVDRAAVRIGMSGGQIRVSECRGAGSYQAQCDDE